MSADVPGSWFRMFHKAGDVLVLLVDLTPYEEREAHDISWLDEE